MNVPKVALPLGEPGMEIDAELSEGHVAQTRKQQALRIFESGRECGVDGLLDEAFRGLAAMAYRKDSGGAECKVDVVKGHPVKVARDRPSPPCPFPEATRPRFRNPPMTRRTTTGLVCIITASRSDVTGPSTSAM